MFSMRPRTSNVKPREATTDVWALLEIKAIEKEGSGGAADVFTDMIPTGSLCSSSLYRSIFNKQQCSATLKT